jgi:hypothetical protein
MHASISSAYTFTPQYEKKASEIQQIYICAVRTRLKKQKTNIWNQNTFTSLEAIYY